MIETEHVPLISVILPARNAERTLYASLQSIIQQTVSDWELILIDDGSTDESISIAKKCGDERIRIVSDGQSLGLPRRLNQAIGLARGAYIARMDADDISFPIRLEVQLAHLETNPGIDLVGARAVTFDDSLNLVGLFSDCVTHDALTSKTWRLIPICHPSWFARTSWFRQNLYAVPEYWLAEDQELLLRTYRHSKFHCTEEVLFAYRLGSRPFRKLLRARFNLLRAFNQHHKAADFPIANLLACVNFASCAALDCVSQIPYIYFMRKSSSSDKIPAAALRTFERTVASTGLRHDHKPQPA